MKYRQLIALGLACTLALAGCSKNQIPESQAPSETAESDKESTQADKESEIEHKESSEQESEAPVNRVTMKIGGYDKDHYPVLDGSLANLPLLTRMMSDMTGVDALTAESYMAGSFENGGTSTSWGKLIDKREDLLISYEPPAEVKEWYSNGLNNLEIDPLGRDGLVFIVNVNNPIESLTVDQIRDIYTGKITNWNQVGGPDSAIKAFQRNSTSGSQTLLQKLVLGDLQAAEPEREMLIETMGGLIEAVADFDGSDMAIGFSVYYYADRMKSNPNLKMIKVDGVAPSNSSIQDNSYPLCNDFYIAINADEAADSPVRAMRDYMLSKDGRTLLEEEGYVWARDGLEEKTHGKGNIFK